jgi:hypothetical protein
MVRAIDDCDVNLSVSQRAGCEQTTEPGTYNHDAMAFHTIEPPDMRDCITRVRPGLLDDGIGDTLVGGGASATNVSTDSRLHGDLADTGVA